MSTIMKSFGALKEDGTISDEARERYIKLYLEASKSGGINLPFPCVPKSEPNPYDVGDDIRDREKYKNWHERWVDGTMQTIFQSLDGKQGFALPVFDPTGVAAALNLDIPDLTLGAIIGSFALPMVSVPALLNIKPLDIPNFLPKLTGLISVPKVPELNFPKPPTWGGPGIPGYPSLEGYNLALSIAIPLAIKGLFENLLDPGFWASFTPAKLFEASCKAVQAAMPKPEGNSSPTAYNANNAAATVQTSEAVAAVVAGKLVGATTLLTELGKKKGYILGKDDKKTPLDVEAIWNGLYKLNPNELNMAVLFPRRNYYYGDPYTISTIQEMALHMYKDESYRSKDEEPLTLEIGNITGYAKNGAKNTNGQRGWRWNPWSKSHAGGSFDTAYPMKNESGKWISGVKDNAIEQNLDIEEGGITPFKSGDGKGNVPFTLNKKLPHDFASLYEMGRWLFCDWLPKCLSEGLLVSWNNPNQATIFLPFQGILIGDEIYKAMGAWMQKTENKEKYGKNWNSKHLALYGKSMIVPGVMFLPEKGHEDHVHFICSRTAAVGPIKNDQDMMKVKHRVYPGKETATYYEKSSFVGENYSSRFTKIKMDIPEGEKNAPETDANLVLQGGKYLARV